MLTLANKAIKHLTANPENCKKTMLNSVCLVTALNPYIGYENSASVAKEALQTGKSVADIVLERGLLTKEKLDEYLTPENMLNPRIEK